MVERRRPFGKRRERRATAERRGADEDEEEEDMQLACRFDFGHINSVTGTKSKASKLKTFS